MSQTKEKIVVLLAAFSAFAAGVWALYHEPVWWRPWVLRGSFVLLGLVALRQTAVKFRKKK